MSICSVNSLCKDYEIFRLDRVSFSLEAGSITGFIGRNGAGKTTTIKSMLNIAHPTSGEVEFFGMPLCGNEKEIKKRIGFSSGAVNYYPKKKLSEIAAVTKAFFENWDDEAYLKYKKLFSLDDGKTPSELSEGMKVKFNLLLALSHRAELLILDEPTSGLDPFSRDEINDIFRMLKENGTAILFSTHITSDIEKCADGIIYIRSGRIISACSKADFGKNLGKVGESIEETVLRLEREARDENDAL